MKEGKEAGADNACEIDSFLDYLIAVRGLSLHTRTAYYQDLKHFSDFLDEYHLPIFDVTFDDARRYMSRMLQSGSAPASVNRQLAGLRSFYRFAYKNGKISNNPFLRISGTTSRRRLPSILSQEEVQEIISQNTDDYKSLRDMVMFNLFYSTGCRLSEIIGANIADLDFNESRMLVTGKGSKERYVFLTERVKSLLHEYLPRKEALQIRYGINSQDDKDAILVNLRGKRLSSQGVHSIFDTYRVKLGIQKRFTPHVFRHSFATHILDNESGIRVVQELLGHASIGTTQIYAHVSQQRLRKVYEESHPHGRKKK